MASGGTSMSEIDSLETLWRKFGVSESVINSIVQSDANNKNSNEVNLTAQLLKEHGIGANFVELDATSGLSRLRRLEINQFRKQLPIHDYKEQLLNLLANNQVVVVKGETGSGKSTQITQYLLESGLYSQRQIGCTQPRRVAATSLARRVAFECGTTVGDGVGYKIRFENCVGSDTKIKYMTDGVLVTEFVNDKDVEDYSVLILDEAHERSVHTDVVLGLLKLCLKRRLDLKVIVTSATLESEKFSSYFNNAPILKIHGRGFQVDVNYLSYNNAEYITESVKKVIEIHQSMPLGDVLVFLPGQEEIERAWDDIVERFNELKRRLPNTVDMIVLPFYSSLPPEALNEISEPTIPGKRKVILATNIAETSLTIDNIMYVVDPGYSKQRDYNPKTGIDSLNVRQITKAQAIQRAGRTGRQARGTVHRLYTVHAFNAMAESPIPEIQRANVEDVVLQLASLGINDIISFPFIDKPQDASVLSAMEYLIELQAIKYSASANHLEITMIGKKMSQFPLEPSLAKVLITSSDLGCAEEVLTIVSVLSAQNSNIFTKPKKMNRDQIKMITSKFNHPMGDHFTILRVYQMWQDYNYKESWCKENFVNFKVLEEALEIRKQLASLMTYHGLRVTSCGYNVSLVQKALCSGYFHKIARKGLRGFAYQAYGGGILEDVFIFPASTLFGTPPAWLLYNEVIKTKKSFMRNVVRIEPIWIKEYSPAFFQKLTKVFPDLLTLC